MNMGRRRGDGSLSTNYIKGFYWAVNPSRSHKGAATAEKGIKIGGRQLTVREISHLEIYYRESLTVYSEASQWGLLPGKWG